MSYEDGEFCQQDDNREEQQDLEEAHFHYIISAFEDLLKQYDPDLVVMKLTFDSVQKLEKSIQKQIPF